MRFGISTDFKVGMVTFPLWPTAHRLWLPPTRADKQHCVVLWSAYFIFLLFFLSFPLFSILAILIFPKAGSFQKWISQIRGMRMFKKLQLGKTDPIFKRIFSHTWQHFTYNLNLKCPLLSVTACAVLSFLVFFCFRGYLEMW